MEKVKSYLKSPKFNESIFPEIKRLLAVVFFTFIYGIGVAWFLEQSDVPIYTGGIPGIAQVIRDILYKTGVMETNGELFMSIFIIVANIPILLLGWFGVSKRFTIYSIISVVIQSTVIGFLPVIPMGISESEHALLASMLGGLLIGVGIGGALKFGTSTGGFDIVAQFWSLKKGVSVGFVSMVLNIVIAIAGALITGGSAEIEEFAVGLIFSYTIVRLIVTTLATDKVHTSYQFLSMEIITESPLEIIEQILYKLGRGVTLSKVYGAYSNSEKTKIMVVISYYEFQNLLDIIDLVDDKAFVIQRPVKNIHGNFTKKRIA